MLLVLSLCWFGETPIWILRPGGVNSARNGAARDCIGSFCVFSPRGELTGGNHLELGLHRCVDGRSHSNLIFRTCHCFKAPVAGSKSPQLKTI